MPESQSPGTASSQGHSLPCDAAPCLQAGWPNQESGKKWIQDLLVLTWGTHPCIFIFPSEFDHVIFLESLQTQGLRLRPSSRHFRILLGKDLADW